MQGPSLRNESELARFESGGPAHLASSFTASPPPSHRSYLHILCLLPGMFFPPSSPGRLLFFLRPQIALDLPREERSLAPSGQGQRHCPCHSCSWTLLYGIFWFASASAAVRLTVTLSAPQGKLSAESVLSRTWVPVPALPLTRYVILSKLEKKKKTTKNHFNSELKQFALFSGKIMINF